MCVRCCTSIVISVRRVIRESRLQDFLIIKDFQISINFTGCKIIKAQKNQSAVHIARMESKKGV